MCELMPAANSPTIPNAATRPRLSYALAGALLAAAFLGAYFLVAATLGFHGPRAPWADYGEVPVGPPVEEPICFFTNLSFILAGIAALRRLDRAAQHGASAENPMAGPSPYSVPLAFLMVWMGPASMLEHGTLTTTWGWFDATSIHWFAMYIVGYLIVRAVAGSASGRKSQIVFFTGQGLAWLLIGIWTWHHESVRKYVSQALLLLIGVAILLSLSLGRFVGLRFRRQGWFAGLLLAFAAAVFFLITGAKGGALAPWGHGLWHVACALAMYSIFRLLETEAAPAVV